MKAFRAYFDFVDMLSEVDAARVAIAFDEATVINDVRTCSDDRYYNLSGQQVETPTKGVYVKNKYNDYVFTPISIIAEVGDKTVVENRTFYDSENDKIISTVKNYDSIKKGDGSGDVDQN
jgi:hypothetical protein